MASRSDRVMLWVMWCKTISRRLWIEMLLFRVCVLLGTREKQRTSVIALCSLSCTLLSIVSQAACFPAMLAKHGAHAAE